MKAAAFLYVLSALAPLLLLTSTASANLAAPSIELHSRLAHEEVDIKITGDEAVVTGTFKFIKASFKDYYLDLYLPVYASPGQALKEYQPEITTGERKYDVFHIKKELGPSRKVQSFGELPQLEGQQVEWFAVSHVEHQPRQKELILKIRYTQKLSNNKFIYTPLIPKQEKGKDYGSITVSADRKLSLLDPEKHSFVEEKGKFIVEPSDKRGIVVELAEPAVKLP